MTGSSLISEDHFDFIFLFSIYYVQWWLEEVWTTFHSFLVCGKEGCMEDWVDLPSGGDTEAESSAEDDFIDLKWTSSLHLEFLRSSHMKVHSLQPYLVTHLPWRELG